MVEGALVYLYSLVPERHTTRPPAVENKSRYKVADHAQECDIISMGIFFICGQFDARKSRENKCLESKDVVKPEPWMISNGLTASLPTETL